MRGVDGEAVVEYVVDERGLRGMTSRRGDDKRDSGCREWLGRTIGGERLGNGGFEEGRRRCTSGGA
jgi:hypothetical protein